MPKLPIFFFNQDVSYDLKKKTQVRSWIAGAIADAGYGLEELNFIFCSDEYLLGLNQQFLNHDTYTDVITFDNSEALKSITGDIFISIDRIRENAAENNVSVGHELHRIMIHGTLHLLGYKDKRKSDKALMTVREDHYLSLL